jgi:hypothetical protein
MLGKRALYTRIHKQKEMEKKKNWLVRAYRDATLTRPFQWWVEINKMMGLRIASPPYPTALALTSLVEKYQPGLHHSDGAV